MNFDVYNDDGDTESISITIENIYFTSSDDTGGHDENPQPGFLEISDTNIHVGVDLSSNPSIVTDLSDVRYRVNGWSNRYT